MVFVIERDGAKEARFFINDVGIQYGTVPIPNLCDVASLNTDMRNTFRAKHRGTLNAHDIPPRPIACRNTILKFSISTEALRTPWTDPSRRAGPHQGQCGKLVS